MKIKMLAFLAIIALASCGTGTSVVFGKDGITVSPPTEPIVIPTK